MKQYYTVELKVRKCSLQTWEHCVLLILVMVLELVAFKVHAVFMMVPSRKDRILSLSVHCKTK